LIIRFSTTVLVAVAKLLASLPLHSLDRRDDAFQLKRTIPPDTPLDTPFAAYAA